jgi:hypothetical protein
VINFIHGLAAGGSVAKTYAWPTIIAPDFLADFRQAFMETRYV